jgi:hypothetical protein
MKKQNIAALNVRSGLDIHPVFLATQNYVKVEMWTKLPEPSDELNSTWTMS